MLEIQKNYSPAYVVTFHFCFTFQIEEQKAHGLLPQLEFNSGKATPGQAVGNRNLHLGNWSGPGLLL